MPAGSRSAQVAGTERVAHECHRLDDDGPLTLRFSLDDIANPLRVALEGGVADPVRQT